MENHGFVLVDDPFETGEVSFHLGWTFHRAGPNCTNAARSVMTIIYMDRDMRLKAPGSRMEEIDRAAFCGATEIGEIIESPMNPLLWGR